MPRAARQRVKDAGLPFRDGLHAASHALLNVVPLYMMCNATDMAAECDNPYDTRFRPERLLLYDKHPGGIGIAAQVRPAVMTEWASFSCSCGTQHVRVCLTVTMCFWGKLSASAFCPKCVFKQGCYVIGNWLAVYCWLMSLMGALSNASGKIL